MSWDHVVDLLVIGSGAAGMSAGLRGRHLGHEVLILEGSDQWGGSTAISGGVVWMPNNPGMNAKGIADSREDSLRYLRHITRKQVPDDRIVAFVDESQRVLQWLHEETHLQLDALEQYADYYPEAPGGKPGGRSMEPVPFDATRIGKHFLTQRRPHPQSQVMGKFGITARVGHGMLVNDLRMKLRVLWLFFRWALRAFKRRGQPRDTRLCAGNALTARLRLSLLDHDVPLWLDAKVTELVTEGGRITGVVVQHEGGAKRIGARQGVVVASGGFERNQAMREKYQRTPVDTEWNAGNIHNVGEGIEMGIAAGAAIDQMDKAWWTPVTRIPKSDKAWVLVIEKSLPGSIFINRYGRRFCNEAAPYEDVVRAMYDGDAVPVCWMIFDAEFRRLYPVGPCAPGYAQPDRMLSRRLREGFLKKGETLGELASALQVDPVALQDTISRFNAMSRIGEDKDFGRGRSVSDRYYGDPRVSPNPTMRALMLGPFYAIPVFPGDLGTKGGLVTDPSARVLDTAGNAIAGLYAAGNASSAVMGPTYPGAGGTIGPALVFGCLAAEAAAADAVVTSREQGVA